MAGAQSRQSAEGSPVSLGRDGGRNLLGTVVSNIANVLVLLLIGRVLGAAETGLYSVAFASRAILIIVCGLGLRIALVKFVAAGLARDDNAVVRGVLRRGIQVSFLVSVLFGIGLGWSAGWWAEVVFGDERLQVPLLLVAASLPFSVMMNVLLAGTQGFSTMKYWARIGLTLEPALRLLLTFCALMAGAGLNGALGAVLAASVVSAVASALALRKVMSALPHGPSRVPTREFIQFSAVSWVATISTQGLLWVDAVLLGLFVSASDIGEYQVASRLALMTGVLIVPLTAAMGPRVAHAFASGEEETVRHTIRQVSRWTMALTVFLVAGVLTAPDAALSIFGEEFDGSVLIVALLALSFLFDAVGTPAAVALNHVGHNGVNMAVNLLALVLNIALNLLLIPAAGIEGAAVAWSVALVLASVVRVVALRQTTGIMNVGSVHLLFLVLGVTVVVLSRYVLGRWELDWWWTIPVAALLVSALYLPGAYLLLRRSLQREQEA